MRVEEDRVGAEDEPQLEPCAEAPHEAAVPVAPPLAAPLLQWHLAPRLPEQGLTLASPCPAWILAKSRTIASLRDLDAAGRIRRAFRHGQQSRALWDRGVYRLAEAAPVEDRLKLRCCAIFAVQSREPVALPRYFRPGNLTQGRREFAGVQHVRAEYPSAAELSAFASGAFCPLAL